MVSTVFECEYRFINVFHVSLCMCRSIHIYDKSSALFQNFSDRYWHISVPRHDIVHPNFNTDRCKCKCICLQSRYTHELGDCTVIPLVFSIETYSFYGLVSSGENSEFFWQLEPIWVRLHEQPFALPNRFSCEMKWNMLNQPFSISSHVYYQPIFRSGQIKSDVLYHLYDIRCTPYL